MSAFRSDGGSGSYYAAQGAKGGLAVWAAKSEDDPAENFRTYADFEEFAGDNWSGDFVSAVSAAMGEDYAEEIDL